jgi:CO/xanthine dehydrogenase Mo-binding subunit
MTQLLLEEERTWVGKPIPTVDGVEKVTGRGIYVYDMNFPNMLHLKVKRSSVSHAYLTDIDSTNAQNIYGVRAIVTAKDFPAKLFGKGLFDSPILAREKVRYVGEVVAAVAAETEDIAAEAVEAINVEYKELPAVYDPVQSASENTSIVIHEKLQSYERSREGPYVVNLVPSRPNVNCYYKVVNGDVDAGLKRADLIIENEYRTPRIHQYHTEPISCIARPEADGSLTIYTGGQETHKIRKVVSVALDIPESKVRVIIPTHVGGAFGNRVSGREEALCAALALKTKRPVKFKLTREEVMSATTSRHAAVIKVKDGVMKTGEIVSRDITVYLAGGAYSTEGITAVPNAARASASTYYFENFRAQIFRTYTNEMEGGAMRAFGYTYLMFAVESQMDAVANKLGIDPIQIRSRHMLKNGQRSVSGEIVSGDALDTCLKSVLQEMGRLAEPLNEKWLVGRGFAVGHKGVYGNFPTVAYAKYNPDDTIEIIAGIFDVGQGARTVMLQLVADEFRTDIKKVRLSPLNSDEIPISPGATGSRQTFHVGNAILAACQDCKSQILEVASKQVGRERTKLELRGEFVYDSSTREKLVAVRDLFKRGPSGGAYVEETGEFVGKGVFFIKTGNLDPVTGKSTTEKSVVYYTPVAAGIDVDVDTETGRTRISKIVVATDAGKILNPKLVEAQIEGCVSQGIGTALTEELVISDGKIINPDNKDYKVPMATDIPEVKSIVLENPVEGFQLGVRGLGEIALAVVPVAITNAISNAIGKRINSMPYTAEKVLSAIKGARMN